MVRPGRAGGTGRALRRHPGGAAAVAAVRYDGCVPMSQPAFTPSSGSRLDPLLAAAEWPRAAADAIRELDERACNHALFPALTSASRLAIFARQHVFAVWDFMALLHAVRAGICPGDVHWTPPVDARSAHLVHEILVEEECGPSVEGEPLSHFESYLVAMRGLGASTADAERFIDALRQGATPDESLDDCAPRAAAEFSRATLATARASLPERIAALCIGRERLIPAMFPVLDAAVRPLGTEVDLRPFRYYLERHIEVDGDEHGPATVELLARHARGNASAAAAAVAALEARVALWDGILEEVATDC